MLDATHELPRGLGLAFAVWYRTEATFGDCDSQFARQEVYSQIHHIFKLLSDQDLVANRAPFRSAKQYQEHSKSEVSVTPNRFSLIASAAMVCCAGGRNTPRA